MINVRYPPDFPFPGRATRCLMTPPPRSASTSPHSARCTASRSAESSIRSFREKALEPAILEDARDGGSPASRLDRKSVVSGKSVSVRVDLGGRRILKKKKNYTT